MDSAKDGPQYRLRLDEKIVLLNKTKFKLLKYIENVDPNKASKQANIPIVAP